MNAEYVEQQLDKASLTTREKSLLSLSFGGEMTDEAFHTLVDGLDLDSENQNYLLMLSSLGFAKGWERFPPEMVPRLKGVHRYHQAHISMGIPWLVQQIRALADEGIPVMLLKGVAVLTYYAPGRPRIMSDYDFAVPEERFDRALELILANGNVVGNPDKYALHSVSVRGSRDSIDLHRWIFKMHNEQFAGIWDRAEMFNLYGVDVRVPTQEDMLIHLLDTQSRNYFRTENSTRWLQWFYDCRDLWEHSEKLSLEHIASRAGELHAMSRVRMMLRLFMQCFPDLVGPEEFERYFPRTPEYERLLIKGEKYKNAAVKYLSYDYNEESAMTPVHILRWLRFEMIHYHYMKPELQLLGPNMNFFRFIKMTYHLDSFSDLAKGYLSRIRLFEKRERED